MELDEKIELWKLRPMSWSSISQFDEYDKEVWYKRYIIGEKWDGNAATDFGKKIGERLASDPEFLPLVPRLPIYEYKLTGKLDDFSLIGYIDSFSHEKKAMLEYKTGKRWDAAKVTKHGQLDLYAALLYMMHNIHPNDLAIHLVWLQTEETGSFETQFVKDMKPVIFSVKKDMRDILAMLARVKRVRKEMIEFIEKRRCYPHPSLDTQPAVEV